MKVARVYEGFVSVTVKPDWSDRETEVIDCSLAGKRVALVVVEDNA